MTTRPHEPSRDERGAKDRVEGVPSHESMDGHDGRRAFEKYEGLGNDFVLVESPAWPLASLTEETVRALCDRHRGVGADGVLWIDRTQSTPGAAASGATESEKAATVRLVIFNADGSRPEMCGNGVRCVTAFLFDRGALSLGETLAVQTDAGPRDARVLAAGSDGSATVEVQMGRVRVATDPLRVARGVDAIAVDVGNPHAVLFSCVEPGREEEIVKAIALRREAWPRGANVEFVRDDGSRGFAVRVHERGVGWTRACGTGAVAVAAAAVFYERNGAQAALTVDAEGDGYDGAPRVRVSLEGGALEVLLAQTEAFDVYEAWMRGPARGVFRGEVSAT